MVVPTFTIFVDTSVPQQAISIPSKSLRKSQRAQELSDATTKENVNPLTGEICQPPFKKRKPSTPSVLTSKAVASSSKASSRPLKSLKSLSTKDRKEREKKKKIAVLETKTKDHELDSAASSITALGSRKAYEFTVMPLADVTQAYDESEAFRSFHSIAKNLESEIETESTICADIVEDNTLKQDNEMDTLSSKEIVDPQLRPLNGSDADN